ncbi:cysteine hydrolase [Hoeflea sp. WL0058]|uniref:Cysteine hydrolase n=1 Tax=Flavimaribacter sediminis TaxID=2865987 RepID=A0AAE3CZH5_9HYPH|nr:isochorismatase family cysteine hydrolase [Flavimaribacter sediminis]MBW8635932.1 cysteine hydrolase [Flavimaribacter sediminis]
MKSVESQPYPFPLAGALSVETTAFLFIDMQGDFCRPGGFMDAQGLDVAALASGLGNAARLLAAARAGGFAVIHTREGYAADLSDAPPNRLWKGRGDDQPAVGDAGPHGRYLIRGEPGWEIMPEVAPIVGETVLDKPSYGTFVSTDIDRRLRAKGVANLVVCGVTSDCCVHQTVQEALDRGFDCLTVADASAAGFAPVHERMMEQIGLKGGVFGAAASTDAVLAALR